MSKVKDWFLNGTMPTGEFEEVEWNDKKLKVSVIKYTFANILDISDTVVVYETSEFGAWKMLSDILDIKMI